MEIKISGTADEIKELFQAKEIRAEQPELKVLGNFVPNRDSINLIYENYNKRKANHCSATSLDDY